MPASDETYVRRLAEQLTIEEKLSLIAGHSTWRSQPIERLGVPSIKLSDGPSGARGEVFGEGIPAAFMPSGVSLGATWDVELLHELGLLIAEETMSKSASVILSPTVCIHRHPLGGRNFESYSEDPFLTGALGTAFVRAVQSQGIAATPKHYVANDQETNRFQYNAVIGQRALREVYLLPFQMIVRDADPWCMMSSYNRVNGSYVDMNKELMIGIPRDEWNWQGVFVSDWGSTHSGAESINAGLDLEMPGPTLRRDVEKTKELVEKGKVDVAQISNSTERLLRLLQRTGRFQDSADRREICLDKPEQRDQLRRAGAEGIVLLKNEENALPLRPDESIKKLAVIGPNANRVVAGGGGSAYIKAPYWTSVYQSLKERFEREGVEVTHHVGSNVNRYLPTPNDITRDPDTGAPGASVDWWDNHDFHGSVRATTHVDDVYYISFGDRPDGLDSETQFSFQLRTILTPKTTGMHRMSLATVGQAELFMDGRSMASLTGAHEDKGNLFFTYGSDELIFEVDMEAGREYEIRIKTRSHDRQLREDLKDMLAPMEDKFQGCRLGFQEQSKSNLPSEAAELAKGCDATVIVVGRDKEWETESQDIPMFELPGDQTRLIQEVAAVCPRTIVLIQAGTPVEMTAWIDLVPAAACCWYQGQELGNAAADVVTGKVNPCGRLPMTIPRRIQDAPSYASFPNEGGRDILYNEGIYVGYRWYDLLGTKPLYAIGHGLSYSDFELSDLALNSSRLTLESRKAKITARVSNKASSQLAGRHTVIAWYSPVSKSKRPRPVNTICGFAKTPGIQPGASASLEIEIDIQTFGAWDPDRGTWVIDAGSEFAIALGTTAAETCEVGKLKVPDEVTWTHRL